MAILDFYLSVPPAASVCVLCGDGFMSASHRPKTVYIYSVMRGGYWKVFDLYVHRYFQMTNCQPPDKSIILFMFLLVFVFGLKKSENVFICSN